MAWDELVTFLRTKWLPFNTSGKVKILGGINFEIFWEDGVKLLG